MTIVRELFAVLRSNCLRIAQLAAVLLIVTVAAPLTAAPDDEKPAVEKPASEKAENDKDAAVRKAHMAAMRRVADGIAVSVSDDGQKRVDLIPEARFRFYDPARNQSDGSIWAYGKSGRPAALLTLTLHPRSDGTLGWLYELNSLSARPVAAKIPGNLGWSARANGIEFKAIPDAPQASEKESGRTRQIRDLSARFAGYERLSNGGGNTLDRFELRLIPAPIHRYSDDEHGIIDGAIFLMTHTTNPEVIMIIELVREGENANWKVGLTRCAFAELHVELDGKEFWTRPHVFGTGASEPYWLFFRPIPASELENE